MKTLKLLLNLACAEITLQCFSPTQIASYRSQGDKRAKKIVSDSVGLVDFAFGLVNSVFNLPDRQVMFFEEFELQKNSEINLLVKKFLGLFEMMSGL